MYRTTLHFFAILIASGVSSGLAQNVVINEVSSVQNDRLLHRPHGASPRLGNLPVWHELNFDVPTFWRTAPGPFGFGYPVATNVSDAVANQTPSLYLRRNFTATPTQVANNNQLELVIDYDDGFVAYLNGIEIARRNTGIAGAYVWHDQPAYNLKPAGISETIPVGVSNELLRDGLNVLAIQLHNSKEGNATLYCSAALQIADATPQSLVVPGDLWRWFAGTRPPSGGLYDPADFLGNDVPGNPKVTAAEFLDWIELKNVSDSPIDLAGWTLTDNAAKPTKWTFPSGTSISAGGYLVVACSGRDITPQANNGLLHTNFSLNAKGEYLALRDADGIIHRELASVPHQNPFHTWGIDEASGQYRFLPLGSPGAANVSGTASGSAGEVHFDKASGFHASPLTVTLSTTTPDATIRYTLDGSEPTELSTVYTGPFDPTIPTSAVPGAGTILRELFVWPPGTTVAPSDLQPEATPTAAELILQLETRSHIGDFYTHRVRGFLHAPESGTYQFWLATDNVGELWLSTDEDPANKRRIAYIDAWSPPRDWTREPTGISGLVSLVAGKKYYIEAIQSETDGGDNLAVGWNGPGLPPGINVIEGRYLSPPTVRPPQTTKFPGAATVRARAFAPNQLPGDVETRTYVTKFDPRLTSVPAIFLSGPADETFYSPGGIFTQVGGGWPYGVWTVNDARFDYNLAVANGRAFERPAVIEFVNPGNSLIERTVAGARFAGSPWSRPQYYLKDTAHTEWNNAPHHKPQINLFFRAEYGKSSLEKRGFIPTSRLREWDTLRLRSGKNDPYNPFILDEWTRRSFAATGAPAPQGFIATLFINGQFKSYFNPTERPRGTFFQEFYATKNSFDVNYIGEWEEGDNVTYGQMIHFFRENDFTSLTTYQQGAAMWDMTNLADYIIINGWAAMQDWPENNYTFFRERTAGALWRFSMWDAEGGFGKFGQSSHHNTFQSDLHLFSVDSPATETATTALVFRRACQNPEFRLLFADRLQKHFFNGGAMTRDEMNIRWNSLREQVEPLVAAVFNEEFDNSLWEAWSDRDNTFLAQARSAQLWPITAAPGVEPSGGLVTAGELVTLRNPNRDGVTYYTTTGNDPRAVGGAPQGIIYSGPITISSSMTIKARILSAQGEWSPLVEVDFNTAPLRIMVTEINYNPPGPDDATEFIEFTNVSHQPAFLKGAHFTKGITFTFGDVTLDPGARIVLVKDAAAFAAAYPGVTIDGVFGGSLDNAGETITLNDAAGAVILSFSYGDSNIAGWPTSPDGDGMTLVLQRPFHHASQPSSPEAWRPSARFGGAPGEADSTRFTDDPLADVDGDGYNALMEYAFGTSDETAYPAPKITSSLDYSGALRISVVHPSAADDVVIEGFESTDLATWSPAVFLGKVQMPDGANSQSTWASSGTFERVFLRLRVRPY